MTKDKTELIPKRHKKEVYLSVTWGELKQRFDGTADKSVLIARYDGEIKFAVVKK